MSPTALSAYVQLPCVLGTIGLWTQAHKRRIAPLMGALSELAWLSWAYFAHVPGLYPWSALWVVLFARTWWKWGKR